MTAITVRNVDVALLDQQRLALVALVWDLPTDHILWGLVEMLDSVIDESRDNPEVTFRRVEHPTCDHDERTSIATCGTCERSWCYECDPGPVALCPWCHGRGHSTAPRASS